MRAAARPATLLLVRHPHTTANDDGGVRMNGWTDAPLSPRGELEAALLRERLSAELADAAVYASPLQRARVVAEGLAASGGPAVACDRDLMEIGCGDVDGWDVERVRRVHPILWRRNELQDDEDFRWPGGESYREFRARCLGAVERIAAAHAGERVVVVTHAGVVSQVLGHLSGTSAARWDLFRPGNASITTLAWTGGAGRVLGFDDRAHLVGERRSCSSS
ncbi:MAG TPA: histidine phosphatase family protein [Anaeromyxobacteraceae bacterium]|nr:histidine phosphatase family protein [Anaeromyxobacteraceae bacterium]